MIATGRGLAVLALALFLGACAQPRGTGDLGIVVEREAGTLLVVDTTQRKTLARVEGLGNLSHATAVFSRDQRFAYIFGRDGGLTKVDMLKGRVAARVVQAGNSVGGAISQDGRLIAVSNYKPGGVRVFDAETLAPVADIPATYGGDGATSKVVGLVDAPGQRFVFSLYDSDEVWMTDLADTANPVTRKFRDVGEKPYDGLITPNGRFYVAGLFGEDGMALLDLWNPDGGIKRVLDGYGRGEQPLPVYKMPHLEGWAIADDHAFFPAVGRHEVLIAEMRTWRQTGAIPVHGQPVFVMARPDGRQVWVNFAFPNNDTVQVIDVPTRRIVKTFTPGKGVLHMEFTPRGEEVWVSVRDADKIVIYDTASLEVVKELPAAKPSGIFFSSRAHRIGL